jgi:hypothetical protein
LVLFRSRSTEIISGSSSVKVIIRDIQTQLSTLAVPAGPDFIWARMSADTRYVTAFSAAGVLIRDRFAGVTSTASGASAWLWPMISANGRYVAALEAASGGRVIVTPNPL